jgi:ubiquinone biosynthesis protein
MSERVGWRAFVQGVRNNLPLWAEKLPDMPMLLHDALAQRPVERAQVKRLTHEIQQLRHEVRHQQQQNQLLWTGSTLLLCASLILSLESKVIWNLPLLATLFGLIGTVMLLLGWLRSR